MYARATDIDRTLRSGQAFLHGLFAPKRCPQPPREAPPAGARLGTAGGEWVGNASSASEGPWGGREGRTAALHTVPERGDTLLRAFDICPPYRQQLKAIRAGEEWQEREREELAPGGVLAAWREAAEAAGPIPHDVEQTWSLWCFVPLFDSINVLLNHGLADALPPALATNAAIAKAAALYHWCRARKYGPEPELGRRGGGLFVRSIRHRLAALAHALDNGGLHAEGAQHQPTPTCKANADQSD